MIDNGKPAPPVTRRRLTRDVPMIIAGVALLACFLPRGVPGDLMSLPDEFVRAGETLTLLKDSAPGSHLEAALWIARLAYLAPLASLAVILWGLRDRVPAGMQLAAATIWLGIVLVVPYAASAVFAAANPELAPLLGASGHASLWSLDLGPGGWLLVLAAIAMILSAIRSAVASP